MNALLDGTIKKPFTSLETTSQLQITETQVPHPQGFPSPLGTISHCYAVHQVSFFQWHPTQHLTTSEVDCIVNHAIVETQLGHYTAPQVANVFTTWGEK